MFFLLVFVKKDIYILNSDSFTIVSKSYASFFEMSLDPWWAVNQGDAEEKGPSPSVTMYYYKHH